MAIAGADKAKVPIAVCGEMAGDPRLTRLLLGLGLRNLSMHPAQLLEIKQRVLTSDVSAIEPHVARMRRTMDPAKLAFQLETLNE
jgi:phosphotransferase system enzyme I (PtsI)